MQDHLQVIPIPMSETLGTVTGKYSPVIKLHPCPRISWARSPCSACSTFGTRTIPIASTCEWAHWPSGHYQLAFSSTDSLGNSGELAFCEFEIDADPPGCSINTTGFFAPASWSGSVTGTTTGTDVAHLTVTIQRRSDLAYFAGNRWQGNGVEKNAGIAAWLLPIHLTFLDHAET